MSLFKSLTSLHVVYSALLGGLIYVLRQTPFQEYLHSALWGALAFFFVQGLFINLSIDWAKQYHPQNLYLFLLGSVAFRLLTSIFGCIFALLIEIGEVQLFILNFFAVYLLYLIFEMTSLVANLRPNLNSQ